VITQHRDGDIAVIEIDRHERRNALDTAHCHDLREALTGEALTGEALIQEARPGHDSARAIVLTGAGSSFCAGADLKVVYDAAFRDALYAMLAAVTEVPVPVLAAVNGPAIGAGAQLALACDLRIVAPEARFAIPAARLGIAVNPWTIRRLALLAGTGTAQAVLIGGETLDADAALRCGLASRLGDRGAALAWARDLSGLAPLSLAYAKKALNEPDSAELAKDFEACWTSDDAAEGQRARADKRPPRFRGR
jgi:enoyl-CoA hydratase